MCIRDRYRAVETKIPGPGKVTLTYQPADGSAPQVMDFPYFHFPFVAMVMHNTSESFSYTHLAEIKERVALLRRQ